MDDISYIVKKVTKNAESEEKARDTIFRFFEEHGDEENCVLIDMLQNFIDNNLVGKKLSKKFIGIQGEIINYLLGNVLGDMDDEVFTTYKKSLQMSIEGFLELNIEIPLTFIPFFYTCPSIITTLGDYNIWTLQQLMSCEQETLLEVFYEKDEVLTSLIIFFQIMDINIKLNTPKG